MTENSTDVLSSISQSRDLEDIAEFWDNHSLADYWDETHEVEFTVRVMPRHRITLDPDVYNQLAQAARLRGISAETLANIWLMQSLKTG